MVIKKYSYIYYTYNTAEFLIMQVNSVMMHLNGNLVISGTFPTELLFYYFIYISYGRDGMKDSGKLKDYDDLPP